MFIVTDGVPEIVNKPVPFIGVTVKLSVGSDTIISLIGTPIFVPVILMVPLAVFVAVILAVKSIVEAADILPVPEAAPEGDIAVPITFPNNLRTPPPMSTASTTSLIPAVPLTSLTNPVTICSLEVRVCVAVNVAAKAPAIVVTVTVHESVILVP